MSQPLPPGTCQCQKCGHVFHSQNPVNKLLRGGMAAFAACPECGSRKSESVARKSMMEVEEIFKFISKANDRDS